MCVCVCVCPSVCLPFIIRLTRESQQSKMCVCVYVSVCVYIYDLQNSSNNTDDLRGSPCIMSFNFLYVPTSCEHIRTYVFIMSNICNKLPRVVLGCVEVKCEGPSWHAG